MLRFRLEDLPRHLRKQAERQIAPLIHQKLQNLDKNHTTASSPPSPKLPKSRKTPKSAPTSPRNLSDDKLIAQTKQTPPAPVFDDSSKFAPHSPSSVEKPSIVEYRGEPNKTERDYNVSILHGKGRYEAITLRLPGGNYTPDWMTIDDGIVTFHECKGAFRFASESRAILAFNQAAAMFPFWRFVWAQKQKGGKWIVKHALNDKLSSGMTQK